MNEAKIFILADPNNPEISICMLSFQSTDYLFRVSKRNMFFAAEPKLANLIRGKEAQIRAELDASSTIFDFCQRFKHLTFPLLVTQSSPRIRVKGNYFKRVLEDIAEIGWDRITNFDTSLSFFEMALLDSKSRIITLRFEIPEAFPAVSPKVYSNLPTEFLFDWGAFSRLKDIADFYQSQLDQFDSLWTQLEDLDKNTIVVEPRGQPPLSCLVRRIVLSDVLHMQLDLTATDLQYAPIHVKFIGPDKIAQEMKKSYEGGASEWNSHYNIRQNFERILQIRFPSPLDQSDGIEACMDCAICYVERLGAELPDIVCGHCKKRFHRSCLVEWLSSRPGLQQSYQSISGNCPFCDQVIQCSTRN